MGPALLPESLERLRMPEALKVIGNGRPATQMPAFGAQLGGDVLSALAAWIYTPVSPAPIWADADIRASRVETPGAKNLPAKPLWSADPMNLFVVVEGGDHHVSLVDGDRFERIHRFASRYALHGGPKFTPDGRFVYFGSRDGWITKYDLWNLTVVAEVRAGLNMRNVAVSGDGRWVMAANYLPHTLALFDADLNLVQTYAAASLDGKTTSRVSAVYDAAPRSSFVVALKDLPELWEISYDRNAAPIYDGYVHDYKMGEGVAKPGYLGVRRTPLDEPLDDFFFDQSYRHVLGATRPKGDGAPNAQVVNLDVRRKIAELPIAGMPHLGSGITFALERHRGAGQPEPEGRRARRDRHEDLEDGDRGRHAGPRILRAQPRGHAVRLDRLDDECDGKGHADDHRQANPEGRGQRARARQDAGAHRIHQGRPLRAGQPVGDRRRADRLRRSHVQGGQTPADEQAGGQVQRLEQDHPLRGNVALSAMGVRRPRQRAAPVRARTPCTDTAGPAHRARAPHTCAGTRGCRS